MTKPILIPIKENVSFRVEPVTETTGHRMMIPFRHSECTRLGTESGSDDNNTPCPWKEGLLLCGGLAVTTFCLFAGGWPLVRPSPRLTLVRREPPAVFGSAPSTGASEAAGGVETGNEYLSGRASITSKT